MFFLVSLFVGGSDMVEGPPISAMKRLICCTRVTMSITRFGMTLIVGSSLAAASIALRPFFPPFFLESGSAAASRRASSRFFLRSALASRSFSHSAWRSGGKSLPLSLLRSARKGQKRRNKPECKKTRTGRTGFLQVFEGAVTD